MKNRMVLKAIFFFSFIASFMINQSPLHCQEDGEDVALGKYRVIHSDILKEDRLLLIHLPREYTETELSYPVLYLLYGHDIQNYFAEAVIVSEKLGGTGEIPPLIIVGVANTNRYRDNLPAKIEGRSDSGGAENFLKFFEEELFPFVENSYRTKNFRILAGPQAGAVFGLYALITKPGLFNAVFSENPFMNPPNAEYLFPKVEAFFKNTDSLRGYLHIKCEKNERELDLDYATKLEALLEDNQPEGFRFTVEFREPSGYFIPPLPFLEGLRGLFEGHKLPADFQAKSVQDVINYYEGLSEKWDFHVDPPSHMLTFEGAELSQQGKIREATELFEYQLSLYPQSLNAFWQLGEIYRRSGDFEKARQNYKSFLDIRSQDVAMVVSRLNQVERIIDASAAYRIEQEINTNGIQAGLKKFRELKADPETKLYFNENEFNAAGYRLMGGGRLKEAIEIFMLNVGMFPDSANAFDSLGEAYMNIGDLKKAIRSYKKSLELNPDNENAKEMLKKLEKKKELPND